MGDSREPTEAARLEALWSGQFGDAYVERNRAAGDGRGAFWDAILQVAPAASVLEVGCNLGGNLRWIVDRLPAGHVWGVDVNREALRRLRADLPGVNAVEAVARELPFRDRWFDLTFTVGVLIHQPASTLPLVLSELVRCSRRWVLCAEYFAETTVEVPYRDQPGALFKRDYGRVVHELFPELALRRSGHVDKPDGFDDVTWWLFERT
jgi:spore coat polysaccharide biosynthesis protein SpsF